jgi:hypothetical protein
MSRIQNKAWDQMIKREAPRFKAIIDNYIVVRASRVIRNSPVDTGLLRSNWVITLKAPSTQLRPPHFPGRKLGRAEKANAAAAIAAVQRALVPRKWDEGFHITNTAHYVEIAMSEAESLIRKEFR